MMRVFALLAAAGVSAIGSTAEKESAMDKMTMDQAIAKSGLTDSSVLSAIKKDKKKGEITAEAIKKALKQINGMLEAVVEEIDDKDIACQEEYIRLDDTLEQVNADLSRYAEETIQAQGLANDSSVRSQNAGAEQTKVQEELDTLEKNYHDQLEIDQGLLRVAEADLGVAEFILSVAKCGPDDGLKHTTHPPPEAALVAQKSHVEICASMDAESREILRLADPQVQAQLELLLKKASPQAHKRLSAIVGEAHNAPLALLQQPAATPAAQPVNKGCSMSKGNNCGLLHDQMAVIWGENRDAVDEQTILMDERKREFENAKAGLQAQIEALVATIASANKDNAEANAAIHAISQQQIEKNRERKNLGDERRDIQIECDASIEKLQFDRECGLRKVRKALEKKAGEAGIEVQDCVVGDFIPGECSAPCDDQMIGGTLMLTRAVITDANENGMKCPTTTYQQKCNQKKCPVNCSMSSWSAYSKCTAECGGGSKSRSREIVDEPKNGGAGCPIVTEPANCNSGSCDRNCKLHEWTRFTPCTRACGGGTKEKYRSIRIPTRGEGTCPKSGSKKRTKVKTCNKKKCMRDEQCISKMDLIIAVDGSGSVGETHLKMAKNFTGELFRRFTGIYRERTRMRLGVVKFGNGELLEGGAVRPPKTLLDLDCYKDGGAECIDAATPDVKDAKEVSHPHTWWKSWEAIKDHESWDYKTDGSGMTNMDQLFPHAAAMFTNAVGGSKKRIRSLMILTDGKPSNNVNTINAAQKLKDTGVIVNMIAVQTIKPDDDQDILDQLVSFPDSDHLLRLSEWRAMSGGTGEQTVTDALTMFCPKASSPYRRCQSVKKYGVEKMLANHDCPIWWDHLGNYHNGKNCAGSAKAKGYKYYVFGGGWWIFRGVCFGHNSESKSGECSFKSWWSGHTGFVRSSFDVYRIKEEKPHCEKPVLGGAPGFLQADGAHAGALAPSDDAQHLFAQVDWTQKESDSRDQRDVGMIAKMGLAHKVTANKRYQDVTPEQAAVLDEKYAHFVDEEWEEGDAELDGASAMEEEQEDES